VATPAQYRAHKVNNQLAALKEVSADSEVFVFVDADVIARDDCLRYLVAPLSNLDIGATTGYRFYIPFKGDWPSLIRSLWNRISAWEMADPAYAFAWGGAMAIRRDTFDKADVRGSWERSADDDLALTTAIKRLGLRVHFVPQCLVASHGDATFKEVMEWMNRQLILTKVYYPALWRRAIARTIVLTVWLMAVLISAVGAIAHDQQMLLALLAGLTLLPVEWAFLFKAQGLWKQLLKANMGEHLSQDVKVMKEPAGDTLAMQSLEEAYNRSFWRFSATLPLAHLVLPWMTLYSILTNRITWRGITYELRSPTETVII
jgi:cellulose synthase/poly-beta-1,6-N-acetylglucosamine synthase-like glycosyltransferase